jgi:Ca2+-binding RTX toxin-like protein
MNKRAGFISVLASVLALIVISTHADPSLAAGNTLPPGRADRIGMPIGIAELTPQICTNGTPANLVAGSGVVTGTTQRDLVLGSASADSMDGRQQNDCILGGDGGDVIDGFNGTDVCIGGAGVDTFVRCETAIQ